LAVLADLNGDGKIDFASANNCQANFQEPCTGVAVALLGSGTATSTITIAPVNGFNGTVNLSCGVAPVVTPSGHVLGQPEFGGERFRHFHCDR